MKTIILLLSLTTSTCVFAANKPIYQVAYQLSEKSKVIKSSTVIIEEGGLGELKSESETEADSFKVSVKTTTTDLLSVDYRFKTLKNGKSLELAKTAVVLTPGASETNEFKDSSGNDFQLKITVTKK